MDTLILKKYIQIIKLNNFRSDLSDISAWKSSLLRWRAVSVFYLNIYQAYVIEVIKYLCFKSSWKDY